MRRRALVGLLLPFLVSVFGSVPAARANQLIDITIPARGDEISARWVPRGPFPPHARVLLPDGYDPAKKYPLLVLLIGLSSKYTDWSDPNGGRIAEIAKDFPGIIVMPEAGDGWYADWWNHGERGDPAWESYYLDQVIPQVLERFPIRSQRRYHALAGVSMGGLGTAYLGGRLPGFFGSIAVISGLVDIDLYPGEGAFQSGTSEAEAGFPRVDPEAVYGPPGDFYERGHNPVNLAANLTRTRVFMATGDGTPVPAFGTGAVGEAEEAAVIRPASDNYAAALAAANVAFTYQVHSGYHDWINFRREFRDAVDWGLFKPVAENPTRWVNDTVATHGELWGFGYRFDAPPDRVVRFSRAGDQLSISAAGSSVNVTTPGDCTFHLQTPAVINLPRKPCAKRAVRIRPRHLRTGRRSRVRVIVSPAVAGTVVRIGRRRARADTAGVADLRLCARTARLLKVGARAPGFDAARAVARVRGPDQACRLGAPASQAPRRDARTGRRDQ